MRVPGPSRSLAAIERVNQELVWQIMVLDHHVAFVLAVSQILHARHELAVGVVDIPGGVLSAPDQAVSLAGQVLGDKLERPVGELEVGQNVTWVEGQGFSTERGGPEALAVQFEREQRDTKDRKSTRLNSSH